MGRKLEIRGFAQSLPENTLPKKLEISSPNSKIGFPPEASLNLRTRNSFLACLEKRKGVLVWSFLQDSLIEYVFGGLALERFDFGQNFRSAHG